MFNDLQKYLYHDIIVHWQRDVKVSLKKTCSRAITEMVNICT